MNQESKIFIANLMNNNISLDTATDDFINLQNIDLSTAASESRAGLKFLNYFTLIERLNTKGNKNISFFQFLENFDDEVLKKPYYKKLYNKLSEENPNECFFKRAKKVFNIYFGSIAAFRPVVAMNIFERYKPTCVLNVCSGWGGFVAGAAAMNVPSVVAIDSNTNLKLPYEDMREILNKYSCSKIDFIIDDIFNVNLSRINYDMVILSPPYFKKEIYSNMPHVHTRKEDWFNKFYIPLFNSIYTHLREGGKMIVNVPAEIYESCLVPQLGAANDLIPLAKHKRKTCNYEEFIYVFYKN